MKKTSKLRTLKRQYRRYIPFPKRTTWRRWFPDFHARNLAHMLKQKRVDCVLDIGANTGQFATKLIGAGYTGRIVSFEPIPQTHQELCREASRFPQWQIADSMALGSETATLKMYLFDSSAMASSKLINQEGLDKSSSSYCTGTLEVPQVRLDDIYFDTVEEGSRTLIKIDVQGGEMDVFQGAQQALAHATGIHIETSFAPMYENESYYLDILQYLRGMGFALYGFSPISPKARYGQVGQMDALLFKDPELLRHFEAEPREG